MSPEKLAQLRRQRALVQQHLDWLDAEIASFASKQISPPEHKPTSAAALDQIDSVEVEGEMPDPQPDPLTASTDAKRGCLILFFIVIGFIALTLIGIYFWKYRDRPLLFPERAANVSDSRIAAT